jgi:GT2 family glycosyltransferase
MHNFVKGTAQGILELFRTAHEVPGAEFILVDDGSTEEDDAALQTLLRMKYYFDTDFTYIRNDPALGFGGANMAGGARSGACMVGQGIQQQHVPDLGHA